jgi:hypothetical protein
VPPDHDAANDPVAALRALTRQAVNPRLEPPARAAGPPAAPAKASWNLAAAMVLGVGVAAGAALVLTSRHPNGPAPTATADTQGLKLGPPMDEPALLAETVTTATAHPFALAQAVLVLLYPSLHSQALAMNRVGAFVEKAGLPRDRVLDDAALDAAIAASGDNFDTYYLGHDYKAADLARFFTTARQDSVALRPEERALQATLQARGMLAPGAVGAIITLPNLTSDGSVDAAARATILRHELSHGIYFTDSAYAAATTQFWNQAMTAAQRTAFRTMLGHEGYDTSNEDLMRNEMQAYLVHTRDARFFNPASLGLPASEIAALRQSFVVSMPAGWLRERAAAGP